MNDFDEAYALFQKAFVPAELRPYEKMKPLFEQAQFVIYGYKNEDKLVAALIVWELENCIFLENFAVDESLRGQGLGGRVLEDVKVKYPEYSIVLEVEEPVDEMSQRRIGFYQRHEFLLNPYSYIQPTLDVLPTNVKLQLMSYPQTIDESQYQRMKKEIFKVVYLKEDE